MKLINKKRLIETFVELASIPSPSGQEEKIAQVLIEKLGSLGFKVQKDVYGNIIAKLDGFGNPIILCAHMDTVAVGEGEIRPAIFSGKIKSSGNTILGADNKDSITAIIEAITVIKENNFLHQAIEIVLTKEEEIISIGAKNLNIALLSGDKCVISDNAAPYGIITVSAPYCFGFEAEIIGRRCHVKEPEKGINAMMIATTAIKKIPIGRVDLLTTSNIGYQISGLKGIIDHVDVKTSDLAKQGRNNVPDMSLVYGEVRGANLKTVIKTLDKIKEVFTKTAKHYGGKVKFLIEKKADGYLFDKQSALVSRVASIFKAQGVNPEYLNSTGGSDANILNGRGIETIVISSTHRNNHQTTEYLIIKDLVRLADFYIRLLQR